MAVPALRIPLGLNMQEFEKNIESAKSHTRQATQFVLKQFAEMNASLGGPAAAGVFAGYGAGALRLVGVFGAVLTAAKLTGDAIAGTRERLAEMVEVAEKASSRGVSVEFFQSFISGAKGAEDKIKDFETALERAYQATKPVLNPDWSVWDEGLTRVSAVEKAMRETRELFTTDQNFSGFDLFKNAQDQDAKIRAVLIYMQQLKAIGQEVAALDIGEKMFGAKFTDQVRQGEQSFDRMLRTLESGSKTGFISNDAAKNAKELDDRLNDAWYTISQRIKPDWDDLANIALRIKNVWTDIISAVATYKIEQNTARPFASSTANDSVNDPDPNNAAFANPRILNAGRRRRGQLPVTSNGEVSGAAALDAMSQGWDYSGYKELPPDRIPLPRGRNTTDAPKPPPVDRGARDPFEVTLDAISKRTAALDAEARTVDAGTAARERAKTVAQLEEAAKRANTAAGKENAEVTAQQRVEIEKQADAMQQAAARLEKARVESSIKFDAKTAFMSAEDVQIASQLRGLYPDVAEALNSVEANAIRANAAMRDLNDTGRDLSRGFAVEFGQSIRSGASAWESFEKAGLTALGRISDKLMSMAADKLWESALGGMKGSNLLSGLFGGGSSELPGWGTSSFVGPLPGNAEGTDSWRGGLTWVGEKGPEILNIPKGAQIIPNDILRQSSGAGGGITYAPQIDARGASAEAVARLEQVMERDRASFEMRTVRAIQSARRSRVPGV